MSTPSTDPAHRWNVDALGRVPACEVVDTDGEIQALLFANAPYCGRPSRVFAYAGVPAGAAAAVPGIVCLHGGGGTAFKEWVALWNARGYAAIAVDLGGRGPDGAPLPDGGPPQTREEKFKDPSVAWRDHWVYHAVAAAVRARSLLASFAGVDGARIAVTGTSWGGYLTCIVAGIERRFTCAMPVYGCGFLHEKRPPIPYLTQMEAGARQRWQDWCDPAAYLADVTMPVLVVSGTNDPAYPLDICQRSYALVKGSVTLSIWAEMPHSHPDSWRAPELQLFADQHLRGGPALPSVGRMARRATAAGTEVGAPISAGRRPIAGELVYTQQRGHWQERRWLRARATLAITGRDDDVYRGRVTAALPDGVSAYYLAVMDSAGAYVCAPPVELAAPPAAPAATRPWPDVVQRW